MTGQADFWSRRKAAVAAEAQAEDAMQAAVLAEPHVDQPAPEARSDAEVLTELGLPHPDTLEPGDDFAAFLQSAVPEHLRRLALRRLWRSNPVLANLDNLIDYGEDYTDAATVIENMQTTYQVGKGMLKHLLALEEAAAKEAAEAEGLPDDIAPDLAAEEDVLLSATADDATMETDIPATYAAPALEIDETEDDMPLPSRRRMRFAFAS